MTLGRLIGAWIVVAIWFLACLVIAPNVTASLLRRPSLPPVRERLGIIVLPLPLLIWKLVEAGALTLFASLWFDSLGSGGWVLIFFLVGLLASVPTQLSTRSDEAHRWLFFAIREFGELVRYGVAGALLAWRLS